MSKRVRVIVIGLDGARLDIVLKWCKEGYLPNISNLIKNGVYGDLESVYPIHSLPAWTSFFTGKTPANHGVYDVLIRKNEHEWRPVCRYDIHGKAIWEILSDYGYTVATISFPVTYPPKKINGIWISGWDTPSEFHKYAYPDELWEMLKSMGYKTTLTADPINEEKFLKELYEQAELRFEIAKWFMDNYDWDALFMMIVTTEMHHHKYASFIDPGHPLFKKEFEEIVRNHYEFIDKKIGELLKKVEKDTYVFIVSDHGFAPFYGKLYINSLLRKYNLIKLKKNYIKYIKFKILNYLKKKGRSIYNFLPKYFKKIAIMKYRSFEVESLKELIDLSKTVAYIPIPNGQIYINKSIIKNSSEYYYIRKYIKSMLVNNSKLKEIIDDVIEKEKIYNVNSKFFNDLPDLYIKFKKLYKVEISPIHPHIIEPASSFNYPREDIGYHTLYGILIAKGPNIKKNKNISNLNPRIIDIAPTILYIFGLPIPKEMDGKVLREIFEFSRIDNIHIHSRCSISQIEKLRIKAKIKEMRQSGKL